MVFNPVVSSEMGKTDILSMNLENRIILLSGAIDDDMALSVISQMLYLDNQAKGEKINLYINSPGGSVSDGLAIYDTMRTLESPVSTVCFGHAASMAAVLLSGGKKGERVLLPHSEVMIHQPSGGVEGQTEDILIAADHIKSLREELNSILAENCGKPLEEIVRATDRDHWMKADEAVAYGIADMVIGR
ncbi:MAG: ATP-dependent Clp protease proteolytic subunit [Lachnospiraceae bacterium]|nr:ATP-dependent Clp protease proteolytic subunit [Lachnospiraceae bacterium]